MFSVGPLVFAFVRLRQIGSGLVAASSTSCSPFPRGKARTDGPVGYVPRLASEDLSKWREVFLALPPRGESALVGAIAAQLGRDPDDVLESLVAGKSMGWNRVGGKVLFHFSDRSPTAPAAAVRVWLGEGGEDEQRKERTAR